MTPVILRIVPDHIEDFEGENLRPAQIQVSGEHFDDSATVHLVGHGICFETIRLSDTELQARCDFYRDRQRHEFNVGLIVLNDPIGFAASTASNNVVPISVHTDEPKPDDDDDIPF